MKGVIWGGRVDEAEENKVIGLSEPWMGGEEMIALN
jgi:hypothetical protein